jgi:hypothetical protein
VSATDVAETGFLSLYFQNVAFANVGDASGLQPSATAGSVYISLHTADPGETGDQTTSESAYTNYARVAVARSAAAWSHAAGVTDNDAAITFPACGATGSTVTHFGIGSATSGAGNRHFNGTASLTVSNGVTPSFAIGALDIAAD